MLKLFAKNYSASTELAIPAVLLALPILVTGVLSVKGLEMENESNEIAGIQLRNELTKRVQKQILDDLQTSALKITREMHRTLDNYTMQHTRNLAAHDDIRFYAIYQNDERIFPPQESTSTLISEKFHLDLLANSTRKALQQPQNKPLFHEPITVPGDYGSTAFFCDNNASETTICVLFHYESFLEIVAQSLHDFSSEAQGYSFLLDDQDLAFSGKSITRRLDPPLHETRIIIREDKTDQTSAHSYLRPAIIGLPLLAVWALLMLLLLRQQQQKIQASRQRTLLAAQLAHDLRTPLANLKLYAELLQRKSAQQEDVQRYAGIISGELENLGSLSERTIQTAYGYSTPQSFTACIPLEAARELTERLEYLTHSAGCTIHLTGTARQRVVLDRLSLESILTQLIDNAIKHGKSPRVDIRLDIKDETMIIQVRDYGSGIAGECVDQVFESGFRASRQTASGYGLGLAGIRRLAKLNGGDVHCIASDDGATFHVRMQVKTA